MNSRSKSKLKRSKREIRPSNRNPLKPGQNGKQTQNKENGTPKPGFFFGKKNKGELCTRNQECFSTNCVFPGETVGTQPKPRPKPKPNRYGSRSINSRSKRNIRSRIPTPIQKPTGTRPKTKGTGTCQAEIEQDPVPIGN